MNQPYGLNPIFLSLNKEIDFTSEILSSGIDQLRKTSFSRKGAYFQSFSSLSIGLERLAKMCVILDYSISNDLLLPDDKYMRGIGHDLDNLYTRCIKIQDLHNIELDFPIKRDDEIYKRILSILSRFAKGDRYSNIDALTNSRRISDPIADWHENVDIFIYDNLVAFKKKIKIEKLARVVHDVLDDQSITMFISQDNQPLDNTYAAALEHSKIELILDIRQIFIVRLIRYIVEILESLLMKYSSLSGKMMPNISDYFAIYMNEDRMIKSRKVFTRRK